MPWAIVQSNTGSTNGSGSVTASLPSGTTVGNQLFVAMVTYFTSAPPAGLGTDVALNQTGLAHKVHLCRKATVAGETSWAFTQSGTEGGVWWAAEISGLAASPLDKTASDAGGNDAAAQTGTTATTAEAPELAIAVVGAERATNVTVPATFSGWTNGFTELADVGNASSFARSVGVAYLDLATTTTVTTTATLSVASHNNGVIATYKLAPTDVAPAPRRPRVHALLVR